MRHLIDFGDLTREEWESLYARTSEIIDAPEQFINACRGRVSCNLFYEPSTRTNFSFQTAMMRLGGFCIWLCGSQLLLSIQGGVHEGYGQNGL